eukprot:1230324-Pleurochrysis_carterae.AAC.1
MQRSYDCFRGEGLRSACIAAARSLDKFYLLSKHALEESLADVRSRGWRGDEVLAFSELLRAGPLARRAPMGMRYYLVDNFCAVLRSLNIGKHASGSEG